MISFCPKCDSKVRLNEPYDPDTRWTCPACDAEFTVAEIMLQDAPSAVRRDPVDEPGPQSATPPSATAGVSEEISLDEMLAETDELDEQLERMFDAEEIDTAGADETSPEFEPVTENDPQAAWGDVDTLLDEDWEAELADELQADELQADELQADELQADELPADPGELPASRSTDTPDFEQDADQKAASRDMSATFQFDDQGPLVQAAGNPGTRGATVPGEGPIKPVPAFQIRPAEDDLANGKRRGNGRKNPVLELIKIALGGVVGLVIAQLILWWLPEGWRRDPLGLAPQLPEAVSFLAPETLRGEVSTGLAVGTDNEPNGDEGAMASGGGPARDSVPAPPSPSGSQSLGDAFDEAQQASGVTPENVASEIDGAEGSVEDLATALAEATMAAEDVRTVFATGDATQDSKREAAHRFAQATAELARAVTASRDDAGQPAVAAARVFVERLTEDPTLVALLDAATAASWGRRGEGGLALSGTVVEVAAVGAFREIDLQLTRGGRPTVTVVTAVDETRFAQPRAGDTMVVLGTLIESPLTSLQGYRGDADRVVWSRLGVVVP